MKIVKNVLTKSPHPDYPLVRFVVTRVKGLGPLSIGINDEGLCWVGMSDSVARLKKEFPKSVLLRDPSLEKLAREVAAVWSGKKKSFSLPLVLAGTGFQMLVWSELLKIKCGATLSYQDIAKKIGKPKAARAVGSAVGSNPISILVPCHRVLGKGPSKLKFGWGPEAKKRLLLAEGMEV